MLIAILIFVYLQALSSLELPDYMAKIINNGILAGDNSVVIHEGVLMLLISLMGGAAMVGVSYLASLIGTGFARDIREHLFAKVEGFSLNEFNKFSTASLITRSTNDIQQIQMVSTMILRMILAAPIIGIWAIFKAYSTAPSMSWVILLAVVVMFSIIMVLFSIAVPKFRALQKLVDKLNLVTRENLTGLRVIRAFTNEKYEEKKFETANVDLTDANLFVNRMMVIMQPMMTLIFNVTSLGIIWVGAHMIGAGNLQIGEMLAFMQYAMQVIMAFLMISMIFIMVPRASVSAKRVAEVIETESSIKDPENPKKSPVGSGEIEFKDVTFTYPSADVPAIEGISFMAHAGQTTAVVGGTGSGKSTLINLIPRFYDVTSGSVTIDNIDVREMKLEDLYHKIGFVPQKAVLFSGSIESNIKYGQPDASDHETASAAEIAQATEFINTLDGNYQWSIAQGGANVSGGQKQRISIARAIVKKPETYIFDDSFSALDFKTDALLRSALSKETKNKTMIVVAQRISTIMHADKIIVLDEGKKVGEGTHEDLLKSCAVYQEIASSQMSDDELHLKGLSAPVSQLPGKGA